MKKSAVISICIFSAIAVSFASSFVVLGTALNPVYNKTYLGEFKHKVDLLKVKGDKKRIILTGGSAVPFGVDSSLIEQNIPDYDVVDFGLYAGLGSNLMIDTVKKEIREGDIVILALEQSKQMLSNYFNTKDTLKAMDGDFSLLKYVDSKYYESLIAEFPSFSMDKLRYTLNPLTIDSIYQKSSFNDEGDIKPELRECNIMGDLYDPTGKVSFNLDLIDSSFVSYLNDFNKTAKKKGASVYYYFAPINELSLEDDSYTAIDNYYEELDKQLDFDILGNPHNSIMDPLWFYDTNYHLNGSGTKVYTKNLIQDLKVLFKDSSKTDIDIPAMPTPTVDEIEGDDTYRDSFSYIKKDDKPYIDRLLDKGLESVVLPYSYDGITIRGFSKDTFQDCDKLKEVVIQENISTILDGSFSQCKNLKSIYLRQTSPNRIKIGDGLLNGTNANIYVPKEALGSYLTDYNFSKFAKRIYSY